MRVPTWLAILAALASGLDAKALYHRVYHPTLAPDAKFSLRGTLHDGVLVDTSSLQTDLAVFSEFISQLDTPQSINEALYQLALERDSDPSSADWLLSSVKACHLHTASSDSIFLHLAGNGEPSAVNYFLSPLPPDGVCPFTMRAEGRVIKPLVFANTTVHVRRPRLPPLPLSWNLIERGSRPELRPPPPLTPEGQVVTPEPEKSFLQKYWIYILAFFVFLAVTPGAPEEEGGGGPGGSGAGRDGG